MISFTKGDPANRDLGPQPRAHVTTCPELRERPNAVLLKGEHPLATTCPTCIGFDGLAQGIVVFEQFTYPEHTYKPTMSWPAGIKRELCARCHGTHAEELEACGFVGKEWNDAEIGAWITEHRLAHGINHHSQLVRKLRGLTGPELDAWLDHYNRTNA